MMRLRTMSYSVLAWAALSACKKEEAALPQTATAEAAVQGKVDLAPAHAPAALPPANPATAAQGLPAGHPPVGQPNLPSGHPPVGAAPAPMMGQQPARGMEDGEVEAEGEMPLLLKGSGSIGELKARLDGLNEESDTIKGALEEGFRLVFTTKRSMRDLAKARTILEPLTAYANPKVQALAERTLGYVEINSGFNATRAKERYERALALDPNYGEAHYALSFTLAINDLTTGKVHFKRALELGVPDTRKLGEQFYAE